ncbi:MAG TPA: hypothetical protein EYP33_05730 [Pyrodictium sp.]|nr:hypothetical protein [Pyrodictium sp.]
MSVIEEVARSLGLEPRVLERDALRLWLQKRLRLVEAEIAEILARYGAGSIEELANWVEQGRLPEHPGWEDLIVLENLLEEKD